jgi:hypothetical protein
MKSQSRPKESALLLSIRGFVDVRMLSDNHHIINLIVGEDLPLNEGVISHLWITSYTALLNIWIPN